VLDWNLANHPAYIELCAIEEDIRSIGPAPYFVKADGQKWETQLEDTDAVFDYIELRGRRNAPAQEAIPVSGLTPLLKCSRELRVAAATKMSELVDELVQQVNAQNEDVQQGVRALDQLLAELRGGAS
jgi:DNA gyrase subunit B